MSDDLVLITHTHFDAFRPVASSAPTLPSSTPGRRQERVMPVDRPTTHANATINVLASEEVMCQIDRAAQITRKTRTEFILAASIAAAEQVLLDQVDFHHTEAQMRALDEILSRVIDTNAPLQRLLTTKPPWEA